MRGQAILPRSGPEGLSLPRGHAAEKGLPDSDYPAGFQPTSQGYSLIDAREDEATRDAWCAHDRLDKILAGAGTRGDQLLRQHMWQRDKRFFPILERVRKFWQPEAAPSSGLGVSSLRQPIDSWFGLEGVAVDIGSSDCHGHRRMLKPADDAANPSTSIYSRMVASGPFVFLAGHIPIRTTEPGKPVVASFDDVPEEGRFLATGRSHPDSRDGPIAAQSWFVYNEIRRALESQGMTMADIVHVRAFLADLRDLATFHRVHGHFFPGVSPALIIIQFAEVGHKGCVVEIEPTALRPGSGFRADTGWPCPAPFSGPAAVRAGPLVLLAGMSGMGEGGSDRNGLRVRRSGSSRIAAVPGDRRKYSVTSGASLVGMAPGAGNAGILRESDWSRSSRLSCIFATTATSTSTNGSASCSCAKTFRHSIASSFRVPDRRKTLLYSWM